MTNEKRFKLDMDFAEALRRFARTDPKELAEQREKIRREEKDVEEFIKRQEEIIRDGERRPKKRFRL